jgi:hypothetical protein
MSKKFNSAQDRFRGTFLALAGLEASLRLVDDVNAPLAADEPIVTVATAQRFQ